MKWKVRWDRSLVVIDISMTSVAREHRRRHPLRSYGKHELLPPQCERILVAGECCQYVFEEDLQAGTCYKFMNNDHKIIYWIILLNMQKARIITLTLKKQYMLTRWIYLPHHMSLLNNQLIHHHQYHLLKSPMIFHGTKLVLWLKMSK